MRAWTVMLLLIACALGTIFMLSGWSGLRSLMGVIGLVFVVGLPALYLLQVWFLVDAIPKHPQLTPALGEPIPEDIEEVDRLLAATGFLRVGGLARLNTRPRTVVVNYVNLELGAYATVQKVWRMAPVCGLISPRAGEAGNLETLGDAGVDGLPAPAGTLRQILANATPAELVAAHTRAMADLRVGGVTFRHVSAQELEEEMRDSMLRQRRLIRSRPLWCTAVLNWRSLTGRYPNVGSFSARRSNAIRISS